MKTGALMWSGALLAVAVAGCGSKEPEGPPTREGTAGTAAAAAHPDAPPGIALADARVQLPVVPGRPGVAYFTISQSSGPAKTIAAVHVAGAGRSEMHASSSGGGVSRMAPVSDLPLDPGKPVRFAPGGTHVMLFDLDPAMKPGGTSELTVVFADGDKASIVAPVTSSGAGSTEKSR